MSRVLHRIRDETFLFSILMDGIIHPRLSLPGRFGILLIQPDQLLKLLKSTILPVLCLSQIAEARKYRHRYCPSV